MRVKGFVSLKSVKDENGNLIPFNTAIDNGWLIGERDKEADGEYPWGHNLFVDQGRQILAYSLGGRLPITDYKITHFGVGTSTQVPNITDTRLISHVPLDPSVEDTQDNFVTRYLRPVGTIDYPAPYIVRVEATLRTTDANGFLLTEFGLFTSAGIMVARIVKPGINKVSSFSPSILWRVRM